MKEAKVSVIISVYNVEDYLEQCLDSVIDQTLGDIEIICVQNGSTDNSPIILKNYKEDDSRIRIIDIKENIGIAAARNRGLKEANGKYIAILDSDDYFHTDALNILYNTAEKTGADLCVFDAQDFDNLTGKKIGHRYIRKPYPDMETFNINDDRENIYSFTATVPWNKFCSRSLIEKNNICFQSIGCMEDVFYSMLLLSCAEKIAVVNKCLINYRRNREGSLINSYSDNINSIFEAFEYTYNELQKRGFLNDPVLAQTFMKKAFASYVYNIRNLKDVAAFEDYYEKLKESIDKFGSEITGIEKISNAMSFIFEAYRKQVAISEDTSQELYSLKEKYNKLLGETEMRTQLENKSAEIEKLKTQLRKAEYKTSEAVKNAINAKKEIESLKEDLDAIKKSKSYKVANKFPVLKKKEKNN